MLQNILSYIKTVELNSLSCPFIATSRLNQQSDVDAVSLGRLKSTSGADFRKSRGEVRAKDEISKLF